MGQVYLKKNIRKITMILAMMLALSVPTGVKAITCIDQTGWMVAAPNTTVQKSLICVNGSVRYNIGMVTVLANGTTGYTSIAQKLNATCVLSIGYDAVVKNKQIFAEVGSHRVSCECKNKAAYGKAEAKHTRAN